MTCSIWQWRREVDLRNAAFLLQALRRTQRMMNAAHDVAEYDLGSPADSAAALHADVDILTT